MTHLHTLVLFLMINQKILSDAQNNKYQKLIDLIKPNNGDKVLEIGCGWGGFAEYLR